MPALPLVPNVIRIALQFEDSASREFGSRFYYTYSGVAPSQAACTAFANTVESAVAAQLIPLLGAGRSLTGVTVTDLSTSTPGVGQWTGSVPGTRGGDSMAASVTTNIEFKIPYVYRGGKPKIFLPTGTINDLSNDQNWTTSYIASVNAAWSGLTAALNGQVESGCTLGQHCTVAYYKGVNKSTPPWRGPGFKYPPAIQDPPQVYLVGSHAARQQFGSQRRRTNP